MRGKLIVIEGTDGCGKETQSKLLEKYLVETMGINVIRCSFPQYDNKSAGPVELYLNGELGSINDMTYLQISSLYAIDRLCTVISQKWNELLENGTWIICDRYVESNIIYQTSKNMDNKSDIIFDIKFLEYHMLKIPMPDMIFYLDLEDSVSQELIKNRNQKTDIHEQNLEYMKKVHECGLMIALQEGWNVIDCNTCDRKSILPKNEIHDKIVEKLKDNI